ncbi:MAG: Nitrite reductase probable [NAD(P)H] subunit (EC [uncultured Thiotrichaceae bacterium]|uniref:Nitrite reductase probable [NAD(P)H] subunit (EC) n=1 Tax=uncultured Thiotrichaceae bacterium TaxID=298394 RepID=A0A6S6SLD9_9GAMM|nr:MAG: Nitrite reductase probable [NAD(P)H] subunit (EC [uncultured Thiotrichaceae bacterium]
MSILNIIKRLFGQEKSSPAQSSTPQPIEPTQASTPVEEVKDSIQTAMNEVTDNIIEAAEPNPTPNTNHEDYSMHHVIIGSGPAGVVAAESIRKLDPKAMITLIGDEPEPPYSRMAIPYFLEENITEEGSHLRKTDNHYDNKNINVVRDRVSSINPDDKTVTLESNDSLLNWDKLLIATGSHPISPPIPGLDNPKVSNCWTLEDSRKIVEGVKPGSVVVQIGAGFIGCIILESLVKRGAALTVVEMGDRMVPRMLDQQCGTMLKTWCENKGVTVLTSSQVNSIEDKGKRLLVSVSNGEPIEADFVISATGVRSNTAFLEGSGIKVDEGILVNRHLETNVPDIFAAGDVAQGLDFSTGEYTVQAIQPTASDHGLISSKNMVNPGSAIHQGAVLMNVLATLGLISVSYGLWEGVEGGESAELVDTDNFRYIRLQFDGDKIVGANTLGITQNIGAIRGLIQSKTALGVWKERLMENPLNFMDAYVGVTGGHT